ncbi:MAG TPA: choice-of-anchor J domain-containing protein, partial [Chryseolinea sp.]
DACINLFTMEQVGRMTTVLENSPRRASLLVSPGLSDPQPIANDLGIRAILSPLDGECDGLVTPIIEVRNYGSNLVSSSRITLSLDGVLIETKNFTIPPLSSLQSTTLSFSPMPLPSGDHVVSFQITLTNGVADPGSSNNILDKTVVVPETIGLPITENFNTIPSGWQIVNPDLNFTWQLASAPNDDPSNIALKMDFFNYEDNLGEIDLLVTPAFDLSTEPVALLLFDVAYARFQDDRDGLKVIVLSDCNADINQGTVVYDKSGAELQTSPPTTDQFVPLNDAQWRTEFIDLSAFAGQDNLQLAFVGVNDWGNNLYLDNIKVVTTPLDDVALIEVISPTPVICETQVPPKVRVRNAGTLVTSLRVRITINGLNSTIQNFDDLNLFGGAEIDLELSPITLTPGANTIVVELLEPNGLPDVNPSNNTSTIYTVVNEAVEEIPTRQNFEGDFEDQWTTINPSGGMNWELKSMGANHVLFFNGYNNTVIGDKSWFVSPRLDFSLATEASLSFDLSYAYRTGYIDRLLVLASMDCGLSYSDTLLNEEGIALANGNSSSSSWLPEDSQWRRNLPINLNAYAGENDVRIAFVFVSANGNNIYLDNIELFVSETPFVVGEPMSVYPSPFILQAQPENPLQVTFSLAEKGPVVIELIDLTGRVLASETPPNVLNQTYIISVPDIQAGMYIVRAKSGMGTFSKRVIIVK